MSAAAIFKFILMGHCVTADLLKTIRSKSPTYWAGRIFMAGMYGILAICLVVILSKVASAQTTTTTTCAPIGTTVTCTSTGPDSVAPPNFSAFSDIIKRNREQAEAAGRQAGQLVNNALRKPQPVAMILTIKCGKYVGGTVVFDNNTTKSLSLDPTPATDANLAAVRTAFPNVRVAAIDAGC